MTAISTAAGMFTGPLCFYYKNNCKYNQRKKNYAYNYCSHKAKRSLIKCWNWTYFFV